MSEQKNNCVFFLALLFLMIFLHFSCVNSQNSDSSNQEKEILLKLNEHWLFPSSLSHWTSSSSDHCSWAEVNCTGGLVTGISLVNRSITETIPSFICDLKNLTTLNLQWNFFPGTFPTFLYNCSNLEYLDLSQNYFVGQLPSDIHRLSSRLEYLNLGGNNFTGDIPSAIGRLQGLKELQLFSNLFNGSFPPEIGNLPNLEKLVLSFNKFSPQVIPSSFTRLSKLKDLWMTQTNLMGEIPEDLGKIETIEYLDLSDNHLTGGIPDALFLLKNLQILYLYKNNLSGPIPQSVQALNLEVIDLSYNNLTGKIPDDFGKLTNLTLLSLYTNQLSGEVPASLGRLTKLRDFLLFTNNLSGEIPQELGKYSMLKNVQLSSNNFVGKLPENICTNGALMALVVFKNNLTGELPNSIANCSSLKYVQLYGNRFSGNLPEGSWTSTNLVWLMVSNNSFSGQLPTKLAPSLTVLEISHNQFSGEITPALSSSCKDLQSFEASNNRLTGNIPEELTSLSSLTILLLDGNNLSGELPSNIISWVALNELSIRGNQLSGKIPSAIGHLPALTYLDLSENDFSGDIPPEIGRLKYSAFNVSSNRLSGKIPWELENAAFDRSFLGNPDLCSSNPLLLGLNSCNALSSSRKSSKISSKFVAAVSSIAAAGVLVTLIYAFFLIRSYRKRKEKMQSTWKLTSFQKLNFTESTILSSLTESHMIGSGGSGKVYKVQVRSLGEYVAVKKMCNITKTDERLEKQFLAEVEILGTIRHSNIVKLLCCISTENSKLLVYEYMENHSLDRWLHYKRKLSSISGSVHHVVLDWPQRLHIAIGAARGLCYMHHDCPTPIIHRDMKSSNILLDSEFNAKIADFGLATILEKQGVHNTMSLVAGSFGYIAPGK